MIKIKKSDPFLLLSFLFLFTAKGHLEIVDTDYTLRTVNAILDDFTMRIEPVDPWMIKRMPNVDADGKIYSQYGIGLIAIFLPIVLFSKFISSFLPFDEVILSHFFLSFYNIPFAILGLWYFRKILRLLGQEDASSNYLTICLATATIFWKYVVTDFSEITQICFLLGAIHSFLNKNNPHRWILVSLHLSALVILKLVFVLIIPAFVILGIIEGIQRNELKRNLFRGSTFLVPAGLFIMSINWLRYGTIFESGYGDQQSAFSIYYFMRDWKDYLVSGDRGLFTFSPLLFLSIFFIKKLYHFDKSFLFLLVWIIFSLYLLTTSWMGWKGGYCWGNRNLVPIVPVIAIFWGMIDFKSIIPRFVFSVLLVFSLPIQVVGVSLKTHELSVISREFRDHPDPFYVPSQLDGSFKLYYEKLFNSSGVYRANLFVKEHNHIINVREYDSFHGYNFWPVHLTKLFHRELLHSVSLLIQILVIFKLILIYYLSIRIMPHNN